MRCTKREMGEGDGSIEDSKRGREKRMKIATLVEKTRDKLHLGYCIFG